MNIIVNGPSGVEVNTALGSLKKTFLKEEGLAEKGSEKFFKVYSLENEIKQSTGLSFFSFLDKDDYDFQEKSFATAIKQLIKKANEENSSHRILTMNYPYFRDDRFFPAFKLEILNNFQPQILITFIDDALTCWKRILQREEEASTRSYFRIRDMFTWRSACTLLGDIIAKNFNIRNFLVAVKHPPVMLYKLIFKPNSRKIYSSYPISSTRGKPETRKIIDDFRNKLHENFCVFDPVTIDDRLLVSFADKQESEISITADSRWPFPNDFSMVSEQGIWEKNSEIRVPIEQIKEVTKPISVNEKSIIDKHILYRDYRLIRDSEALIAGRPFFLGRPSGGVTSEIQYASQTVGIPCFMYWNQKEDGHPKDSPFAGKGQYYENIEKLMSDVAKI